MFVDKDNSLWIGTAINGMMKFDPGKQKFNLYSKAFPASNPLGFDVAWGATIDNEGNFIDVKVKQKDGHSRKYSSYKITGNIKNNFKRLLIKYLLICFNIN